MADATKRDPLAVRFGENLYRARRATGFSQEEVSFRASLHRTEIGLLERGQREPRIGTLVKVAAALSVSPLELLDGIVWELPKANEGQIRIEPPEDE